MRYRLEVRVNPGSSHRRAIWRNDHLKVNLKSPPENGKANEELIEYIAGLFEVDEANVEIRRGKTSRKKTLSLDNLDREQLVRKMDLLSQ